MAEFNEVVQQIEDSEKNVDKVLKAGRLERHERQPMSTERLRLVLNYTIGTVAMLLALRTSVPDCVLYRLIGRCT